MLVKEESNLKSRDEEIKFKSCDKDTIVCKDCRYSQKLGIENGSCDIYRIKPLKVYFENDLCPSYMPRLSQN